jgi:hypothetical protein
MTGVTQGTLRSGVTRSKPRNDQYRKLYLFAGIGKKPLIVINFSYGVPSNGFKMNRFKLGLWINYGRRLTRSFYGLTNNSSSVGIRGLS